MLIEVKVPQLSESVSEATLVSWHKKEGDTVSRDENLIDIETDKVVLETPAPADGVLLEILVAEGLGKCYAMFERPADRLKQLLFGRFRSYHREFWALRGVDLGIRTGEVVGLVGRNGAGKSTLLQLICGTLEPTEGKLAVRGRIAALLELGSGFNPDFSGRENVYLNAAILGLNSREVDARLDDILSFADIGDFVDQPVRTYSSGMFVRLAFAVATSVDPDILVIDEALSVGDGAFARKSFERIMGMKEAGKTILFCSHSIYSVEVLCNRALWIEHGQLRMQGSAAEVTSAYAASLESPMIGEEPGRTRLAMLTGGARIIRASACVGGVCGARVSAVSGLSDLSVTIEFAIDPGLIPPSVAVVFGDSAHQVAALCHKVRDHTVKDHTVIIAFARKKHKVIHGYRRLISEQFDHHRTVICFHVSFVFFLGVDLHCRGGAPLFCHTSLLE